MENEMSNAIHIGLCDGRHPIKQNSILFNTDGTYTYQDNPTAGEGMDLFVYPAEVDKPLDFEGHRKMAFDFMQGCILRDEHTKVYLYVTGLSSLLTSFLKVWIGNDELYKQVPLVLMHYDRDIEQYKEEYWG